MSNAFWAWKVGLKMRCLYRGFPFRPTSFVGVSVTRLNLASHHSPTRVERVASHPFCEFCPYSWLRRKFLTVARLGSGGGVGGGREGRRGPRCFFFP